MDITREWTRNRGIKGSIVEKQEYTVAGILHKVDEEHVVLRPIGRERVIAAMLGKRYGKMVGFVPQVLYPQGMQTPDYLVMARGLA